MSPDLKPLKFIGCEIIYREACYLAATVPRRVDVEFLRKGLHDLERQDMLAKVQSAVDAAAAEDRYEAILLGYARCNDGLAGLRAPTIPLVVPRAHDCVTYFFGSRAGYRQYFDTHPGTFYMTTGWSERDTVAGDGYDRPAYDTQGVMGKLGLADDYQTLVEKYGEENARFVMQSLGDWRQNYSRLCYLKMGVCDETDIVEAARSEAAERDWQFELRDGDLTLLRRLFAGQWDDDFVIVQPGQSIVACNDHRVLDAE